MIYVRYLESFRQNYIFRKVIFSKTSVYVPLRIRRSFSPHFRFMPSCRALEVPFIIVIARFPCVLVLVCVGLNDVGGKIKKAAFFLKKRSLCT